MLEDVSPVKAVEASAPRQGSRWRSACRFALSVACAGALSVWLARALRRPLSVTTDIVGYSIHANFNSFNYFNQYYVAVLFFPLASLALYVIVGRVWRSSRWPEADREAAPPRASALVTPLGQVAPSFAVGLSLGWIWLVWGTSGGRRDLWIAAGLALLYVVIVSVVATLVARRSGGEATSARAGFDAALAPFSLLLVEAVSRNTWVAVQSPPAVFRYHPIPSSLTLTVLVVTLLTSWSRVRHARGLAALRRIELQGVLFVAIPCLLFACTASLWGPIGQVDLFHDGEQTGAANIVLRGAFPWRDVIFIHGLLQDVLTPLLGFRIFGRTIWGALSGYSYFLAPACWVAHYLLFVYLFPRRFSMVLAALTVTFTSYFGLLHLRYLPYPLILLALGALLRTPSWGRALLLAAGLVAGNILVPELGYAGTSLWSGPCRVRLVTPGERRFSLERLSSHVEGLRRRRRPLGHLGLVPGGAWRPVELRRLLPDFRPRARAHRCDSDPERELPERPLRRTDGAASVPGRADDLGLHRRMEEWKAARRARLGHDRRSDRDRPVLSEVSQPS